MKKTPSETVVSKKTKSAPSKKTQVASVATKSAPTSKKTSVVQKNTPKTESKKVVPTKKIVSTQKTSPKVSVTPEKTTSVNKISPKKNPKVSTSQASQMSTPAEGVKMLGILHIIGNILSGGTLGIILVIAYLLVKKDTISQLEKETCYEIINFNLSFWIYTLLASGIFALGMILTMILIGFVLLPVLPIVLLTWFVLLILGFLSHLVGDNYKYPFVIRFIS